MTPFPGLASDGGMMASGFVHCAAEDRSPPVRFYPLCPMYPITGG